MQAEDLQNIRHKLLKYLAQKGNQFSLEDKKFETIMETLSFFQLIGEWGIEISDESELSDSDDTRNKK